MSLLISLSWRDGRLGSSSKTADIDRGPDPQLDPHQAAVERQGKQVGRSASGACRLAASSRIWMHVFLLFFLRRCLQMPHSTRERVSLSASLYLFVSTESPLLVAALRPSLHVPQAASAFQPHCFYSISRHYQRRYDHRVHSAAGEQWRRLAVFSLVCHLYCPTPLTGIKWGLSIRSALLYSTSPPLWSLKDTQGH